MRYKITWTDQAGKNLRLVLRFWREHNGSDAYIKRIIKAVKEEENLISIMPYCRMEKYSVEFDRKLHISNILRRFSLFYEVRGKDIIILDFVSQAQLNITESTISKYNK